MDNEELKRIKEDGTRFVDELKDKVHDQYDEIKGKDKIIVMLTKQLNEKDKEIDRLNNIINESRRILGEYKHYSTPDEIQNMFNEEIVDKAYIKLHSNLQELKGSDKE